MAQSVANSLNAAMRVYDKNIASQVFEKNILWQNVLKNVAQKRGTTNKYLPLKYGRNIGNAAGGESMTLPTAGNQQYLQAVVPMKLNFHTVSLTDYALQAGKNSEEYLVDLLQTEYDGAKEDMKRQLSRQGYGNGSGVICRINGVGSTPDFDLDTPMVGKNPTDYFEAGATGVGSPVMVDSSATSATSEVYTVVSTITSDDNFTLATGSGVADNDYVFLAHNNGTATPSVSNRASEIMGIKGLIDDSSNVTTLQNLSRATYRWWNSYVNSNATQRLLNEALMHKTFLEGKKKGDITLGITSYDLFSSYGQLLSSDRRYTETMELKGGFKGVKFNDIALVADYDHPYDEMNFIDPTTLSVEEMTEMSFMQDDGSILDRSATTAAYTAVLRYYANLAISAPNKNSVLRDVI